MSYYKSGSVFKALALFFGVTIFINNAIAGAGQVKLHRKLPGFSIGVIDTVTSKILGERRVINIYLPGGYAANDSIKYPVIYLLDGSADEDFIHTVGLVQFLNMINAMPNSIVVGIANVDRKRDFTHPATVPDDLKLLPTSGGSQKFIAFIENELQPYVQQHYKVSNQKTIIGQSLGGLLATEILLKKPVMFNNYIIVSPSLWWNNESLLLSAPAIIDTVNFGAGINICIAIGNEGKQMETDADTLAKDLQKARRGRVRINYISLPEETHLTILHRALYQAFEILYPAKK